MEKNIKLKFFEDSLVQRVVDFTELKFASKAEAKEKINVLKTEIKKIYKEKDDSLKQHIKKQLVELKQNHIKTFLGLEIKFL